MSQVNASPERFNRLRSWANLFLYWEIWPVALAAGLCLVTDRALLPTLLLMIVWWPLRWLGLGRLTVDTPVDRVLLLLLLLLPVTLSISILPEITQLQVARLLAGMGLAYAMVNWANSESRLAWLVSGLVLAGVFLAAVAPLAVNLPNGKLAFIPIAIYALANIISPDLINPNVMGGALALLLPIMVAPPLLGYRSLSWLEWILYPLAIVTVGGILVLTQSRGALVGVAGAMGLLVALRWRWGWAAVLFGGLFLATIVSQAGLDFVLDAPSADSAISSLEGRLEIWSRAISVVQDFPVTGVGMGLFGPVMDGLYPLLRISATGIPHAHNIYLQVAADLGLPGLVVWLAAWFLVSLTALQTFLRGRQLDHGWLMALGGGLLGSQIVLAIHGLFDAALWGMTRPSLLVWAVWGVTLAAHRVSQIPVISRPSAG